MILVKIYFSIFSRFNAIFPVARDPNFQAEEEDISISNNMHCNSELCEDENDSVVLLWRSPLLSRRILFHLWIAFASRS